MAGAYHAPRMVVVPAVGASSLGANPPQQTTFTISTVTSTLNSAGALVFPTALRSLVNSHHHHLQRQRGFQRDIGFKTVVGGGYVGSFAPPDRTAQHHGGRHGQAWIVVIPTSLVIRKTAIPSGTAAGNDFLRPFKGYGDINQNTWGGTSNYNGLQVQVNRRYAAGFQYGLAYTYSKSFDYANDDTSDVNAGRPYKAFNYSPSDFDQTHILTVITFTHPRPEPPLEP
jgi:hypothetical protein